MMNTINVKEYLIENTNKLIEILEDAGFCHIQEPKRNDLRCAFDETTNHTSISINIETMGVVDYSRNIRGDIFTLVGYKLKLDFIETFKFFKRHLDGVTLKKRVGLFGGYTRRLRIGGVDDEQETIYDDIDDRYVFKCNRRFLDDGISLEVQRKFHIMYDFMTDRIVVPWRTENGVVGTTGRINEDDFHKDIPKWLVLDNFSKSKYVYGYYENYSTILQNNLAVIGESEKFVMQMASMGYDFGLAIGRKTILPRQLDLIRHLGVKVILAFDEDVQEHELIAECEKFTKGLFGNIKVGYLIDRENKYLPKGSKMSPTDLPKEKFSAMMRECVVWYDNVE